MLPASIPSIEGSWTHFSRLAGEGLNQYTTGLCEGRCSHALLLWLFHFNIKYNINIPYPVEQKERVNKHLNRNVIQYIRS